MKRALERQPHLSVWDYEYVKAFFWLRNTAQSGGFGPNPIAMEAYARFIELLLAGLITDINVGIVEQGLVTILHRADTKYLAIEASKQKAKDDKKSNKASKGGK